MEHNFIRIECFRPGAMLERTAFSEGIARLCDILIMDKSFVVIGTRLVFANSVVGDRRDGWRVTGGVCRGGGGEWPVLARMGAAYHA